MMKKETLMKKLKYSNAQNMAIVKQVVCQS